MFVLCLSLCDSVILAVTCIPNKMYCTTVIKFRHYINYIKLSLSVLACECVFAHSRLRLFLRVSACDAGSCRVNFAVWALAR